MNDRKPPENQLRALLQGAFEEARRQNDAFALVAYRAIETWLWKRT